MNAKRIEDMVNELRIASRTAGACSVNDILDAHVMGRVIGLAELPGLEDSYVAARVREIVAAQKIIRSELLQAA
jgi:hypothetical protein